MKSMILSIALLCSPIAVATLPTFSRLAYELSDEKAGGSVQEDAQQPAMSEEDQAEQEAEDAFDAFIDDEDVPSDMIIPAKPVSPCEAYLKEIGVQLLMKYFTFKIWLEHLMQSSTKSA